MPSGNILGQIHVGIVRFPHAGNSTAAACFKAQRVVVDGRIVVAGMRPLGVDGGIGREHGIRRNLCAAALFGVPAVEAGIDDIFYRLWNAGLGECEVWYNDGSEPDGPILNSQVKDMINRGINASAGMLIVNPNARNTAKIGIGNEFFKKGSIQYVGSEIRAVILNKMMVDTQDDVCVIGGESIAIETALLAPEGTVIAVEYSATDRDTMEENVDHFGLQNVKIIDHVDEETMRDCPVPSTVFMVASASMNQELEYFVKKNPNVHVVIYTLDFQVAAGAGEMLSKLGIQDVETIQIAVSRLSANHSFKQQPAPWIITGRGE